MAILFFVFDPFMWLLIIDILKIKEKNSLIFGHVFLGPFHIIFWIIEDCTWMNAMNLDQI